MAVRSILELEVDPDGAFAKFAAGYQRYQDALSKSPKFIAEATSETDKQVKSFRELVDLAKQKMLLTRATTEVEKAAHEELYGEEDRARQKVERAAKDKAALEKRAGEEAKLQAKAWSDMAKSAKGFASGIGSATTSLLQWASLSGVIAGIVGAGGLFGIDRLAISVGNQRRSTLGLGVSAGEQASFGLNFGKLVNPDQFLGGVNEAMHDVTKRGAFYSAGLSENDLKGKDAAQIGAELIPALKRLADKTPDNMMANVLQARRVDQFNITLDDFIRLKNTPMGEINKTGIQYRADIKGLDISQTQMQAWQNLQIQLDRAKDKIENTFVIGLTPLTPQINELSESFSGVIEAFLGAPEVKQGLIDLNAGLQALTGWLKGKDTPWNDTKAVPIKPDVKDEHWSLLGRFLYKNFDRLREPDNWLSKEVPKFLDDDARAFSGPIAPISFLKDSPLPFNGPGAGTADAGFDPSAVRPAIFSMPEERPSWGGRAANDAGTAPDAVRPASFAVPKGFGTSNLERFAHSFFRGFGWSEAQVAGILGNIKAESGFNPKAFNPAGGGEGAYGLVQWRGPRADEFERLVGHSIRQSTPLEQLLFTEYELTHSMKSVGDALRAMGKDPASAADIVNRDYEVSGTGSAKRQTLADLYSHIYRHPATRLKIENATGGNATITASQLAV